MPEAGTGQTGAVFTPAGITSEVLQKLRGFGGQRSTAARRGGRTFSNFETLGGLSLEVKAMDGDGRAVVRSLQRLCLGCQVSTLLETLLPSRIEGWSVDEASGEAMN
jgi:hypothetical protein